MYENDVNSQNNSRNFFHFETLKKGFANLHHRIFQDDIPRAYIYTLNARGFLARAFQAVQGFCKGKDEKRRRREIGLVGGVI